MAVASHRKISAANYKQVLKPSRALTQPDENLNQYPVICQCLFAMLSHVEIIDKINQINK
jgi:hypothetical protein